MRENYLHQVLSICL